MSRASIYSKFQATICKKYKLWSGLLMLFLVSFVYHPTLDYGYNVDDYLVVQGNTVVHSGIAGIPTLLTSYYQEIDGDRFEWRPVTKITYAIEFELFGENPRISHAVNVFLYLFLILLILLLLETLLQGEGKEIVIALAVIVFAVHPLHVEVVASLKNREILISCMFGIGAALCWFRGEKNSSTLVRTGVTFSLLLLSMITKISGMVFLVIIPLIHLAVTRDGFLKFVRVSGLLGVPLLSYGALILLFFPDTFNRIYGQPFFESHLAYIENTASYYATAFYTVFYNLKLLFVASPLSFFYGYSEIGQYYWTESDSWFGLFSFMVVLAVLFGPNLRLRLSSVFIMPTLLLFSNLLLPVPGAVADRILFLPVLGLGLMVGAAGLWLLNKLPRTMGPWVVVLMWSLVIGYYTNISANRVHLWKDQLTLVSADSDKFPKSAVGHALLAKTWLEEAETNNSNPKLRSEFYVKAIVEMERFVEIHPPMGNVVNFQIASIYHFRLNRQKDALKYYRKSLDSWSLNKQSPNNNHISAIHEVVPERIMSRIEELAIAN